MSDLRQAAQQALEALGLWATGRDMDAVALNDLIFRLEGALADPEQPEQEDEMQKMLRSLGFDDQCPESIGITLRRWKDGYAAALKQPEQPEQDQFCDSHCTWLDHHPECVRAKQERNA